MDFSKIEETREENQKPEDNLVFHYNREERLKRAPKIVQDYYSGNFKPYKVACRNKREQASLCYDCLHFWNYFVREIFRAGKAKRNLE